MSSRIGFYICHCGVNIAGKVDVEEVAKFAQGLDNVEVARDYKFMCSDPGQELIRNDIFFREIAKYFYLFCFALN